jgi:hypothetical protein
VRAGVCTSRFVAVCKTMSLPASIILYSILNNLIYFVVQYEKYFQLYTEALSSESSVCIIGHWIPFQLREEEGTSFPHCSCFR